MIEVLISLALIAVTCLFVVSVLPSLVSSVHRSRDRWAIAIEARDLILAHSTKGDFEDVLFEKSEMSSTTQIHGRTHLVRGARTYRGTLTDTERKVVTVTTTWTDSTGRHELILETIQCRM